MTESDARQRVLVVHEDPIEAAGIQVSLETHLGIPVEVQSYYDPALPAGDHGVTLVIAGSGDLVRPLRDRFPGVQMLALISADSAPRQADGAGVIVLPRPFQTAELISVASSLIAAAAAAAAESPG